MAAQTIPEPDALQLCAIPKTGAPPEDWVFSNPEVWKMGFGVVCRPPRRGFLVELYASGGFRLERRKLNIGLWDTLDGAYDRVYQLTIAPSWLPTHGEAGEVWYGSHEHIGNKASRLSELCDASFEEALKFFCDRTSLSLEDPIENPFEFKLK